MVFRVEFWLSPCHLRWIPKFSSDSRIYRVDWLFLVLECWILKRWGWRR